MFNYVKRYNIKNEIVNIISLIVVLVIVALLLICFYKSVVVDILRKSIRTMTHCLLLKMMAECFYYLKL